MSVCNFFVLKEVINMTFSNLQIWTEHESVSICRRQQTEPVDLDHCLRAFTSEEKLEESYHCGHCKSRQPATKKLQIWKLPPILIVHLKRFNFVNNKWVKSQKVVNFPFKNFDPTPYLASVPQETILRHKELIEHGSTSVLTNGFSSCSSSNTENDSSPGEMTPEHSIMSYSIKEVDTIDTESTAIDPTNDVINDISIKSDQSKRGAGIMSDVKSTNTSQTNNNNKLNSQDVKVEQSPSSKPAIHSSKRVNSNTASIKMRKRLVSTSLSKSPVIDGAFVDYHKHHLDEGQDAFDLKYKLYAVVVSAHTHYSFAHT